MLKNAYVLAKIGADTAKNEQHSAEISPINQSRDEADIAGEPRRSGEAEGWTAWLVRAWSGASSGEVSIQLKRRSVFKKEKTQESACN